MTTTSTTHDKLSNVIEEIDNVIASLGYAQKDPDTAIRPAAILSICLKQLTKVSSQLTDYSTCSTTTTTQQPNLPVESPTSIPAFLRTPKPYPEQQAVELPTSLRGEAVAENSALFAPYDGGMGIGFRIQLARENLDLTEAELAIKLNTYSDHISDWECEITEPPASMIIPLANALKCDPMWLLGVNGPTTLINEAPLSPVKVMQGVDMAGVGERIRNARVSRRMTHKELEEAAGLPDRVISVWESRKAYPPDEAFDKLAKALNTSVIWLLTGREIARES